MIETFRRLGELLNLELVNIDNDVFRLHYKLTMILMLLSSIIVTSVQYIGNPIMCSPTDESISNVINTYCWIHSTFTIPSKTNDDLIPGVAPYDQNEDEVRYHYYYQWVCFALFFQAVLFNVPKLTWNALEGGLIKELTKMSKFTDVTDENGKFAFTDEENLKKKCEFISKYFALNSNHLNYYSIKFVCCEILNLANVIGQMFFMDAILNGHFWSYGLAVAKHDRTDKSQINPMSAIFPKVAKCTFHKYGPSGSLEVDDAYCVLPMNVVNEKIYLFLWYWFIVLAIVTSLTVAYRILILKSTKLRKALLKTKVKLDEPNALSHLNDLLGHGDWFLFYQILDNVDFKVRKCLSYKLLEALCQKRGQLPLSTYHIQDISFEGTSFLETAI